MNVSRTQSNGHDRFDVAVIGAGPGGSSAAAALAALGWNVLLVERDRLPRHKVCGEFLSPESQGTLRELGLHADLSALRPIELTEVQLVSRHGRQLVVPLPAPGWGVSRYAMDAGLAAAAQRRGATLWQGKYGDRPDPRWGQPCRGHARRRRGSTDPCPCRADGRRDVQSPPSCWPNRCRSGPSG